MTTLIPRALGEFDREQVEMLSRRERRVLAMRYGFFDEKPRTLMEVASVFGCSPDDVRQQENDALKKLTVLRESSLHVPH